MVAMKDYQATVERLRKDAAEAALIRDVATDGTKRAVYDKLHRDLNQLADRIEQAMQASERK